MVRTLQRGETLHIINLACIMLAFGVTGFYIESQASSFQVALLGNVLLTPAYISDYFLKMFFGIKIMGNSTGMFLVSWLAYLVLTRRLAQYLIVPNYHASDLVQWYRNRFR